MSFIICFQLNVLMLKHFFQLRSPNHRKEHVFYNLHASVGGPPWPMVFHRLVSRCGGTYPCAFSGHFWDPPCLKMFERVVRSLLLHRLLVCMLVTCHLIYTVYIYIYIYVCIYCVLIYTFNIYYVNIFIYTHILIFIFISISSI